jgi:ribosomal protein L40E
MLIEIWLKGRKWMKKAIFAFFLALVLIFVRTGNATGEAQAPDLSIGNTWTYSVHLALGDIVGEVEEGFEDVTIQGTIKMVIESEQTIEVLNRSYVAWVLDLEGDFGIEFTYNVPGLGSVVMSAPATSEGTLYLDTESFEYVKASFSIWSYFSRYSFSFSLLIETESYFNISIDSWDFPYEIGSVGVTSGYGFSHFHYLAQADGDILGENETAQSYEYNSTYECLDRQDVNVEAGDFEAFRVNVSSLGVYFFGYSEGYRYEYYSNDVKGNVKVEIFGSGGELLGEWDLISFEESPAAEDLIILLVLLIIIVVMILILIAPWLRSRKSRQRMIEDDSPLRTKVCRRCGAQIKDGQETCPDCGSTIR